VVLDELMVAAAKAFAKIAALRRWEFGMAVTIVMFRIGGTTLLQIATGGFDALMKALVPDL
jgi:hypothetical protein